MNAKLKYLDIIFGPYSDRWFQREIVHSTPLAHTPKAPTALTMSARRTIDVKSIEKKAYSKWNQEIPSFYDEIERSLKVLHSRLERGQYQAFFGEGVLGHFIDSTIDPLNQFEIWPWWQMPDEWPPLAIDRQRLPKVYKFFLYFS